MSNGTDPIPIPIEEFPRDLEPIAGTTISLPYALIREAFRQGWESSRHWPNHPLPQHLFVTVLPDRDEITLRIEWP